MIFTFHSYLPASKYHEVSIVTHIVIAINHGKHFSMFPLPTSHVYM
jgi:hypothetical protein